MPLMTWSDSLSVGVTKIDDQHKHLIECLNTLHDAMKAGKGRDVIARVLDELLRYTDYHFGAEEALFAQYAYPQQDEHKAEHDSLRAQVTDLQQKYLANHLAITLDTTAFLKSWIANHISVCDVAFGAFLQTKGMR